MMGAKGQGAGFYGYGDGRRFQCAWTDIIPYRGTLAPLAFSACIQCFCETSVPQKHKALMRHCGAIVAQACP